MSSLSALLQATASGGVPYLRMNPEQHTMRGTAISAGISISLRERPVRYRKPLPNAMAMGYGAGLGLGIGLTVWQGFRAE